MTKIQDISCYFGILGHEQGVSRCVNELNQPQYMTGPQHMVGHANGSSIIAYNVCGLLRICDLSEPALMTTYRQQDGWGKDLKPCQYRCGISFLVCFLYTSYSIPKKAFMAASSILILLWSAKKTGIVKATKPTT